MQIPEAASEKLAAPLLSTNVKQRKGGRNGLKYVEAWYCIDQMNKIFGFGAWNHEIYTLTEVARVCISGEGREARYNVTFLSESIVRVGNATYRDTGTGHGLNQPLGDAIESASKEAVSDSMKRTMRHLGYQFGLALYDKEFANVIHPDDVPQTSEKTAHPVASSESTGVESTSESQPSTDDGIDFEITNALSGRSKTTQGEPTGFQKWLDACQKQKFRIGMENYYHALGTNGFERSNQIFDKETQREVFDAFKVCASIPFLDHINQIRAAFDDLEKVDVFDRWMQLLKIAASEIPEDRFDQIIEGLYETLYETKKKMKK
jgi:hypothetical protein|tara:strand:- start:492 stop:1451 length:960 start_codon:yes stop_codon:yes gene_type:complete